MLWKILYMIMAIIIALIGVALFVFMLFVCVWGWATGEFSNVSADISAGSIVVVALLFIVAILMMWAGAWLSKDSIKSVIRKKSTSKPTRYPPDEPGEE